MTLGYVHGYTERETRRLSEQSQTLAALLHGDMRLEEGARVLEAGCGVGAQTPHLLAAGPSARVTAVDVSAGSLEQAHRRLAEHPGRDRVEFVHADLLDPPFAPASFDHVFVCFVLEHLADPAAALARLRTLLRPGGTVTVIEGDHASALFHPRSGYADALTEALVGLQAQAGGDALVGRRLHPLLEQAGFVDAAAGPRTVYADRSRPALVNGFIRNTYIAMVESVRARALEEGVVAPEDWEHGIADLERTAEDGGTSTTPSSRPPPAPRTPQHPRDTEAAPTPAC